MLLQGLTPPYTPSGCSSLVPPPPWHYAGDVVSLAFDVDRGHADTLLPEGLGPSTGRAYGHFCEWQATTDGSELLDPVYAQYREFFILIETERAEGAALFCPFIYVDQDISMVRGLLQGWPKKMGSVWITRTHQSVGNHPAAAGRRVGQKIGATLAVKDRRLAHAELTLTGEPGERLGFMSIPTFGLVGKPSIVGAITEGDRKLVRARVEQSVCGPLVSGVGTLQLFESPRDELSLLRPMGSVTASIGQFALTIAGAIEAVPS